MYVAEYFMMEGITDAWVKGDSRYVLLWRQDVDGKLAAEYTVGFSDDPENPDPLVPEIVIAFNAIATIGYSASFSHLCSVVKINETYWVVGIDCGG